MSTTGGPAPVPLKAAPGEGSRIRLVVAALVALGAFALADIDLPLRGGDYERAAAAALQHVGPGTVTDTELDALGAGREVEGPPA